jgi:hypothetical protein
MDEQTREMLNARLTKMEEGSLAHYRKQQTDEQRKRFLIKYGVPQS